MPLDRLLEHAVEGDKRIGEDWRPRRQLAPIRVLVAGGAPEAAAPSEAIGDRRLALVEDIYAEGATVLDLRP
jgi:hypothetical protein